MAGDDVTGASTFRLEAGLDTGPVYGVMTERIRPTDTAGDLLDRLAVGGAGLLVATVDGIADGTLTPVPQESEGVSLAPKLEPADAFVDWTGPAMAVDRRVRGCTPSPGAWTTFRGERLGLLPVRVDPEYAGPALAAAQIAAGKHEVRVGTGAGAVLLTDVRPHGRKQMAAADWARGVRIEPGERFGDG
jgi:methionyl-tRNA formyltransferase